MKIQFKNIKMFILINILCVTNVLAYIKEPVDIAISKEKYVVTAGYKSKVKLWDFTTKKQLWIYQAKGGYRTWMGWMSGVSTVDLSPDASMVVLTDQYDNRVTILDARLGTVLKHLKVNDKEPYSAKFSPNNDMIIATYDDGFIQLFDIKNNKTKILVHDQDSSFRTITFSKDSKYLITAGWNKNDKYVFKLWDIKKAKVLMKYKGHKDSIRDVAFSNNGKILASASEDNTFIIWDVKTGKILQQTKAHLGGSFPSIDKVLFTRDDKFLITAGSDKKIELWDYTSGQMIKEPYQPKGCVSGLDISEKGNIVVVSSIGCTTSSDRVELNTFEYFELPFASNSYDKEMNNDFIRVKKEDIIEKYGLFLNKYDNEIIKYYPSREALVSKVKNKLVQKTTEKLKLISENKTELIKYIKSPFVSKKLKNQAKDILLKLVEEQSTIQDYQWFIKTYLNTPQAKEARENLYTLLKQKNNIAAYEWFIKTYPKAPQVKDAIANIHKLAFEKTEDIDTISAYNTFIISYPMAKEVSQANELAKELERYKYTDTLPSWFRSIMPDFLADIFNSIFGIFSSDEKKSRSLLIKAKQIERQGNEYYGDKKAGYVMITNRMYDLLQEEYDDTDATLRFLESEEFKDFVRTFKRVMHSMNDRLDDISRYSSEILEVSKQGFSEANADRDMSEYYAQQHRKWQKNMHLRDKGYQ